MEDNVNLQIRDNFQRGSTEEDAFKDICLHQGLDTPFDSIVRNWFELAHSYDSVLYGEIRKDHQKLLYSIIGQYAKFTHAIFHREVTNLSYVEEAFVSSRFNLTINCNNGSLELFDTYNEESRMLQSTIAKPEKDHFYFPTSISNSRILLIQGGSGIDHLFLLEIDVDTSECLVVDELVLDFRCYGIICDSMDSTQFLFHEIDGLTFYKGQISDDRISVAGHQIKFELRLFYCKLMNDRLFGFQYEGDDMNLVEYDLSSELPHKLNRWRCSTGPVIFEEEYKYIWSGNKLYVALQLYVIFSHFSIFLFNADSRTWSKMKFVGTGIVRVLTIDEDEILIIGATENHLKTIYHLPICKPDKLRYLAWKAIRRAALFFGSKIYDNLLPRLPFNSEFRLFAEDG